MYNISSNIKNINSEPCVSDPDDEAVGLVSSCVLAGVIKFAIFNIS
jgi:hypothetical protein